MSDWVSVSANAGRILANTIQDKPRCSPRKIAEQPLGQEADALAEFVNRP